MPHQLIYGLLWFTMFFRIDDSFFFYYYAVLLSYQSFFSLDLSCSLVESEGDLTHITTTDGQNS